MAAKSEHRFEKAWQGIEVALVTECHLKRWKPAFSCPLHLQYGRLISRGSACIMSHHRRACWNIQVPFSVSNTDWYVICVCASWLGCFFTQEQGQGDPHFATRKLESVQAIQGLELDKFRAIYTHHYLVLSNYCTLQKVIFKLDFFFSPPRYKSCPFRLFHNNSTYMSGTFLV